MAHVENFTASQNRPLIYLTSAKTSKEQTAMTVLESNPVEEGLICILSVVEYCQTLQPVKKSDGKLELSTVNRKCKYYYFYFIDKNFGFMHVKLQTWFPFLIQVYVNGREMMKHIFDENGITYQMYDNSFFEISDIPKAQELADRFDARSLCRQLDFFAHKVNPYLAAIEEVFHQGYHWCVDQCEYATDVMFKSRDALEDIYPSLVGHAFYDFKCTDVFSFLGRKLNAKFLGEAVSDYRKRPEGWRIKFKVFKDVHHRDGTTSKRWVPMGKSIANLYRYAEISKAANKHFLDSMQNIIPVKSLEKEINRLCSCMKVNGKTVTGFNVWEPDTFLLLETISQGKYLIKGFTNRDIRAELFSTKPDTKKQSGKTSRLTYKSVT